MIPSSLISLLAIFLILVSTPLCSAAAEFSIQCNHEPYTVDLFPKPPYTYIPGPFAIDCRFLLSQIPSLPQNPNPLTSSGSSVHYPNPFAEVVLRHRSCSLSVRGIKLKGAPTVSSGGNSATLIQISDFSSQRLQRMLSNLLSGTKMVGEKVVARCVDGSSARGRAEVRMSWESYRVQFVVNVNGVEGRDHQNEIIQHLREQVTTGLAGDDQMVEGGWGFRVLYFDV